MGHDRATALTKAIPVAAPDAAEQMHDVSLEALVPVLVEFFAR